MATGDLGPNRLDHDSIFDYVRDTPGDPAGAIAIKNAGFDVISFATNRG